MSYNPWRLPNFLLPPLNSMLPMVTVSIRIGSMRSPYKEYKFWWIIFLKNARMNNRIDFNLGEVVYISIIFHIPVSWLNLLNGYVFIFDGPTQSKHFCSRLYLPPKLSTTSFSLENLRLILSSSIKTTCALWDYSPFNYIERYCNGVDFLLWSYHTLNDELRSRCCVQDAFHFNVK